MTSEKSSVEEKQDSVRIFVNGVMQVLHTVQVTVDELIKLGGGHPKDYELELRHGERGPVEHTYKDPNEIIQIKNGEHFTTHYIGTINPASTCQTTLA